MTPVRKAALFQAVVSTALGAKCVHDGEFLVAVWLAVMVAMTMIQFHFVADFEVLTDDDIARKGGKRVQEERKTQGDDED